MASFSRGIVTESYSHKFREGGYRIDIARAASRNSGGTVITAQGGLTDNLSKSMGTSEKDINNKRGLAYALIEASGGELIVASVATVRPGGLLEKAVGSTRSRSHRSKANGGAARYMRDRFQPDTQLMGGQSLGGISALDGALWHADPMPHRRKPSDVRIDGVVTMDSPGIFGPLEYDGPLLEGLFMLVKNCMTDMSHLSLLERAKSMGPLVLNLSSPLEYAYVMDEVGFSNRADFSGEVAQLRKFGVAVSHIFHDDDCIPGAEVESPHSVSFPGGHVRFMYEPEGPAEHIVGFAEELASAREAVIDSYHSSQFATAGY